MLSRAEQIDVLRYWEEIELLTPPDYRVVENERLLVCEWKSGRPQAAKLKRLRSGRRNAGKNPSSIPNAPLEAW